MNVYYSKTDMWNKVVRWFEPIGLLLLLAAFGWQCLEEHSNQTKLEGYIYELNEKTLNIWSGIYDEALHSDRYKGEAMVIVNYDALNAQMKDWHQIQKGLNTVEMQANTFFWLRVVLFVLGSVLVIATKLPKHEFR